ncbi:MAG: helicase-exonuclease AddAB subunit AddB [Syntrophomonadaceae bacterium]|nr:helicase-exonuclease AddAB subunit AddB [Syntrophomonadaceae bacterium]
MTVRYLTGRNSTAKSQHIFSEIKQALHSGTENRLILLVPDQFTFQTERDLICSLDVPGIMQVEVLSFNRLGERVINEAGGRTRTTIDEQGKHMVLRKVINDNLHNLGIYSKVAEHPGFVEQVSELIAEIKRYQVNIDDMVAACTSEAMLAKTSDIKVIYNAFNDYLQGRYIDLEDKSNLVVEKMTNCSWLKDSHIWIDDFITFTPQRLQVIEQLLLLAEEITFSFTLDLSASRRDAQLFSPSNYTYKKIHSLADNLGLKQELIVVPDIDADQKVALKHLEKELYAYPSRVWEDEVEGLSVFAAANISSEVEQAASRIIKFARENSWHWKDIVIICSDMENYSYLIRRIFPEYGIPFFIDDKRDIMDNPIIEYLMALLDILIRNFRFDDVVRMLKTGLLDLTADDVEELENYMLAYGIQGDKWKHDFIYGPPEELEKLNQLRIRIAEPIFELQTNIKSATSYAARTRQLYDFLEQRSIQTGLLNWIEDLREQNLHEQVLQNTQVWNIVMQIFDQIVTIMGDDICTLKEYRSVLESGFTSFKLGMIPPTVDQVIIGSLQRLKSRGARGLIVLGVNDGKLPAAGNPNGILLDEEKQGLEEKGIILSSSREQRMDEERFIIYSALTRATDEVVLSYALADVQGKALRPSLLIDRVKKIFPRIKQNSDLVENRMSQLQLVSTPISTYKYLIENMRRFLDDKPIEDFWWDILGWYQNNPDWEALHTMTGKAFFHRNQLHYVEPKEAKRLYTRPFRTNVSQLEKFAACPFAHFIQYGMRARERKQYTVEFPDIGNIFHESILKYGNRISEEKHDWLNLTQDQCEVMVDEIMEELTADYGNGVFQSNNRYMNLKDRLKRVSRRATWTITEHMKKGEFQLLGHEIAFGKGKDFPAIEVELNNGEILYLEGRVDRIDYFNLPDSTYIKIIDYKSGNKYMQIDDVYYGLSLQLFIYLSALLKSDHPNFQSTLKPAGVFYFKIDDPMITTEQMDMDKIESELRKALKMRGITLKDVEVVRAIDREIVKDSEVLPVTLKSDGDFSKNSSVLSEDEWHVILNYVEAKVAGLSEQILSGRVSIEPYKKNNNDNACTYCNYKAICQFDMLFEGNQYKYLQKYNMEQVLQLMEKSEEG